MKTKIILTLIIALAFIRLSYAQINISGTITSADDGQPQPGVSVIEKGTTNGTISHMNGHYSILVTNEKSELIFSFMGFKTETVRVGNNTTIDFVLTSDNLALDEVVVTGYRISRRDISTGATVSNNFAVKSGKTKKKVNSALNGQVSGLQISKSNGNPGNSSQIKIRGISSEKGNSQPLYIVDGVPVNNINSIKQEDIDDIEVLKDASSTGIYGSRGANGVIVITTKNEESSESDVNSPLGFKKIDKKQTGNESNTENESYTNIIENEFKKVLFEPLSTFSIDVDRASYSNVRRFINEGQKPPADAVRIEEMINYFNYDYPEPEGDQPIAVYSEIAACPWQPKHKLLHIGLQGKKMDTDKLPPSNIVFLIDVSGSMQDENKLPLLKEGFKLLANNLRENDKVSIVVYAGAAGVVLPPTHGNNKQKIIEALDKLQSGGSTAGGAGINLAYSIAKENFIENGNNRVILATDGDFNVGTSSDNEMERLIEEKGKDGIFLTCLGFGMGNYKDSKMEILADKGNGNYAYIDNIEEAKKTLVSEFGSTLFVIAKDVKLQIEFNPMKVKAYRLIGYENRLLNVEDFDNDIKDAGEMGAGHSVTALYEIIPAGVESEYNQSVGELKYQSTKVNIEAENSGEMANLSIRYKEPKSAKSLKFVTPLKDSEKLIEDCSSDYRFSASVALFGMLLRNSKLITGADYQTVLQLAENSKGNDTGSYRTEFIELVRRFNLSL